MNEQRSRLLIALLLSLLMMVLLAQRASSQERVPSPSLPTEQDLAELYGIDPAQLYPGSLTVRALRLQLEAAEAELTPRLESAWNDGYKAAALEWKPRALGAEAEVLGLKAILVDTDRDLAKARLSVSWRGTIIAVTVGVAAAEAVVILVSALIN